MIALIEFVKSSETVKAIKSARFTDDIMVTNNAGNETPTTSWIYVVIPKNKEDVINKLTNDTHKATVIVADEALKTVAFENISVEDCSASPYARTLPEKELVKRCRPALHRAGASSFFKNL